MPVYQSTLTRTFSVLINAEDPNKAKHLSELYIGYTDGSSEQDRKMYHFQILEIDMIINDAIEAMLTPV